MGNTPSIRRFSKYQKKQVVFYGDIFGFKQCMDDIDRNKNYERNDKDGIFVDLDIIYNAEIYKIDERIAESKVNFIWLSDSFAFASDVERWHTLKRKLLNFISLLWSCDFIFSGALAFGDLHNGKNIMGATFSKAVLLQEVCHTPEIVIDKSFYNQGLLSEKEIYVNEDSKICFDYIFSMLEVMNESNNCASLECLYSLCSVGITNCESKVQSKYIYMIVMVLRAIKKIHILSDCLKEMECKFQGLLNA